MTGKPTQIKLLSSYFILVNGVFLRLFHGSCYLCLFLFCVSGVFILPVLFLSLWRSNRAQNSDRHNERASGRERGEEDSRQDKHHY